MFTICNVVILIVRNLLVPVCYVVLSFFTHIYYMSVHPGSGIPSLLLFVIYYYFPEPFKEDVVI